MRPLFENMTTDVNQSAKIGDYGIHIGGARKEQVTGRSTKTSDKEGLVKFTHPFWLPVGYMVDHLDHVKVNPYYEECSNRNKVGDGKYCIIYRKGRYDRIIKFGYTDMTEAVNALPTEFVDSVIKIGESEGAYYLYKILKTAKERLTVKSGFATAEEARQYRAENALSLLEFKFVAPELPHLKSIERTGTDYRNGKNITAKDLCDIFGFPGIEFGNWLTQKERQAVLNYAFDAFMDLAHVTGLPYRAMSFNGLLAAAFGSRGKANALAHFESGRYVFNLSRLKGAGSLAHEWFHALDNFVGASAEGIRLSRNAKGLIYGNESGIFATDRYKTECDENWKAVVTEFTSLRDIMRFRMTEVDMNETGEIAQLQKQADRYQRIVKERGESILNELKADHSKYYRRGGKSATPEQLAETEAILQEIYAGNQGAECIHPNRSLYQHAWYYRSYEQVEKLAKVVKAVRNTDYFGDNKMMSNFSNAIFWREKTKSEISQKSEQKTEIRRVSTDYYSNSRQIDRYRTSPYWATTIEMAARAFGAYVQDRLEEKDNKSQYLVHSHRDKEGSELKAYPSGEERATINAHFDHLFKQVRELFE